MGHHHHDCWCWPLRSPHRSPDCRYKCLLETHSAARSSEEDLHRPRGVGRGSRCRVQTSSHGPPFRHCREGARLCCFQSSEGVLVSHGRLPRPLHARLESVALALTIHREEDGQSDAKLKLDKFQKRLPVVVPTGTKKKEEKVPVGFVTPAVEMGQLTLGDGKKKRMKAKGPIVKKSAIKEKTTNKKETTIKEEAKHEDQTVAESDTKEYSLLKEDQSDKEGEGDALASDSEESDGSSYLSADDDECSALASNDEYEADQLILESEDDDEGVEEGSSEEEGSQS